MGHGLSVAALPAETMRGLRFVEDFYDKSSMLRNEWTLANNPIVDDGITVDGVNQKAEHVGPVLGVQSVSFWITLGSTTEDILQLSAAHSIEVGAGTLTATGWAAPTIMVNGVATATITTARSFVTITTATPFDADDIAVGEVAAFGDFKMEALKIWANGCVLSLQEALDSANEETWDWENLVSVNLQMRTQDLDPVNHLTLDSSKHGAHFTLGNGAGANEPVQGKGRMVFAGAEYLHRLAVAQPAGAFTVAFTGISRFAIAATAYWGGHSGISNWGLFRLNPGAYRFYVGGVFSASANYSDTMMHTIVGVYNGSTAQIYVDGLAFAPSGATVPSGGTATMAVGSNSIFGQNMTGDIFDFKYRDGEAWTPTAVLDYHNSQMAVLGAQL